MRQLRFGQFLLDPARRELWRGEKLLNLPPKVFDCIAHLAEHRDRAVGRDELIATVWGRSEVSDNLLDQVMLRARRSLDDTDDERRVIRTVPRFGYAWVAPTELVDAARQAFVPQPPGETDAVSIAVAGIGPITASGSLFYRHRAWLLFGAAIVVAMILASWTSWKPAEPQRVAVVGAGAMQTQIALLLPVKIEADPKYAWARLGAMELMADRLRAAGQAVMPADNVLALVRDFRGDPPDQTQLQAIVDASAAGLVLQARAVLSAGFWRVTVQSLRGRTPSLLAEGEGRDLLEAAKAAADRTARLLGLTPPRDGDVLSPRERALSGVLQQVEAAMLADQPDTARALLDSLDREQAAQPEARYRRAGIELRSGNLDAAQKVFQALLDSNSAADDPLFRARVLNGLGNIALRRDDYAEVAQYADAVTSVLATTLPSPELGHAVMGRAIARSAQSRFDAAVVDFARARVILESVGDRLGLARVDANLGILEARRDHSAEALPLLDRSADQLANFHDLTSELFARVAAVYAQLALLDAPAALDGDARLRELVQREPNAQWKRYATLARSDVLTANGKLGEAHALLQSVLDDSAAAGDDALLGSARIVAARAAMADGDATAAARAAHEVLKTSWQAETAREQATAWLTLVRAQTALKEPHAVDESLANLAAWATREGTPVARLYATLARAEWSAGSGAGRPVVAVEAIDADFADALAQADALRVPEDILRVCVSYAQVLLARGDYPRAGTIAARTAPWAEKSYEAALLQVRVYHALGQTEPWRNALERTRQLAGERVLPIALSMQPGSAGAR